MRYQGTVITLKAQAHGACPLIPTSDEVCHDRFECTKGTEREEPGFTFRVVFSDIEESISVNVVDMQGVPNPRRSIQIVGRAGRWIDDTSDSLSAERWPICATAPKAA